MVQVWLLICKSLCIGGGGQVRLLLCYRAIEQLLMCSRAIFSQRSQPIPSRTGLADRPDSNWGYLTDHLKAWRAQTTHFLGNIQTAIAS